jgi:hypothetical protein
MEVEKGSSEKTGKCKSSQSVNITNAAKASSGRIALTINGNRVVYLRDLTDEAFPSKYKEG